MNPSPESELESELICRCDFDESACKVMSKTCGRPSPGFRPRSEVEAASAKWEAAVLPIVLKLANEANPKSPLSPKFDHVGNKADNGEIGSHPFPVSLLPPILRFIATEAANSERVPVAITAAAAIATASAAIGAGLALRSGANRLTHANLYMIVAAKSGTGKGRAFSLVARPLQQIERQRVERWRVGEKPNLEARLRVAKKSIEGHEKKAEKASPFDRDSIITGIEQLNRQIATLTTELKEPLWTVADVTREALADALSRGNLEALASLSPEARGVVDVLGGRYHEGRSDEDIYLSAFSVESFTMHRIGRPATHLTAPCLTVFWMIQPDTLRSMFSKEAFTESGLLPRFIVFDSKVEPQLIPEQPYVMHPSASSEWQTLLEDLTASFHERTDTAPVEVLLSPEAFDAFRQYENQTIEDRRTGGHLADISMYPARWAEIALRIALVFHAADYGSDASSVQLSFATACDAMEVMTWFTREQMSILRVGRESKQQDLLARVEGILRGTMGEGMTLRDLEKGHNVTRTQIESLCFEYPEKLMINERKPNGPGRPATVVKLTTQPKPKA